MPIVAIAYGILAIVGGIIGYQKAGSKVSLISGIVSGILLILGGLAGLVGFGLGLILARVVTIILIIVFGIRLVKTGKFMPAGIMLIAGIITLILI